MKLKIAEQQVKPMTIDIMAQVKLSLSQKSIEQASKMCIIHVTEEMPNEP